MGKNPGSAIAKQLEDYDESKFNVLQPVVVVNPEAASQVIVQSVSVRTLKVGDDTYNDFRFASERQGKFALNGMALNKIANDAGVKWIEAAVVEARERRPDGHIYVRVRATGAVLQANGEYYHITKHKDIDTADLAQEFADQFRKKAKREKQAVTDEMVEDYVRDRLIQVKPHVLSLCETKAQFRVIRALLVLKQVYTQQELARPFIVPRLMYRPEAAAALEQGRRAAGELYGGPTPLSDAGSDMGPATGESPPRDDVPAVEATSGGRTTTPECEPRSAAGPTFPEDPGPVEPKDDPVIEDAGKHKGERMSRVAEIDRSYLEGVAASGRTKRLRELAAAWIEFQYPRMAG